MAYFDVLIKNGMIFNGKGDPAERADIGISGDKIDEIGNLQKDTGREVIDAEGKYICPGFIDITSHSDTHGTLFTEPTQESLVRQGVTTILGGNCGFSIAPALKTNSSNININWRTMAEMLDELERHKLGVNFATLVGFNTLESEASEAKQIKFLLEEALEAGAFGMSANLGKGDGYFLNDDDLAELFKLLKKKRGIVKHHLEDEGKNILPSLSHVIGLARETGTDLVISHFKVLGRSAWSHFEEALVMMRNARQEGINLFCDFFPYERTGSNLFSFLPPWLIKMSEKEIMEIITTKGDKRRQEIVDYLKNITLHYNRITVASSARQSGNVGKTITEIGNDLGMAPEEVILNLLEANNLSVSIFSEVINLEHVSAIAKENYSVISSDGIGYGKLKAKTRLPDGQGSELKADLPHPRSFGAFPKALKMFVKEKQVLTWEKAIHKMTGLPASILGIKDRGVLEIGKKADIVIINPDEISDYSTYDNPFQFSKGVESVLVNGSVVLADNEMVGKFAGRVLRKK
ncbi:MAG: amidohydrolase family protein [Candidatus Paceibacterota bacterium]